MPAIAAQTIDLSQWTPRENGEVWGTDKSGTGGRVEYLIADWDGEPPFYITRPSQAQPQYRDLWSQYAPDVEGQATLESDATETFNGLPVIKQTMGNDLTNEGAMPAPYFQFLPRTAAGGSMFARTALAQYMNRGEWEFNKYNRLELYVKVPPETHYTRPNIRQEGFYIGTYWADYVSGNPADDEAGSGWHGYHYFNLRPGCWHRLQMEHHPSHLRVPIGDAGVDVGNMQYPTDGDTEHNYFDLMTRFYMRQRQSAIAATGAVFKWGPFKFYEELNVEDEENVYNISGGYDPATNTLDLRWCCRKDNTANHEVCYSFFNIHQIGFDNAIQLGEVARTSTGGYNGMHYETNAINVTGQNKIYFGIRKVGETLFKQMLIPLDMGDS